MSPTETAATIDAETFQNTLFGGLLRASRRFGRSTPILADDQILADGRTQPMSYGRIVLGALVLGNKLKAGTRRGETVGVMLPNVAGLVVTLFGLNAFGRVAALLNFTAGSRNILSALDTGVVATVITSRRFVEKAGLEDVIAAIEQSTTRSGAPRRIVYLEDVRDTIGSLDKLKGAAGALRAATVHRDYALRPTDPAVVLFTSGTEGVPKAVVLSNENLLANAEQIITHAEGIIGPADRMMNPLPIFHSFGLTAGTLMPLMNGIFVILYPSPRFYKQIPKFIRDHKPTFLVATDSFMQGYARQAAPGDLDSLKHVVAGAERVKESTRALWASSGAVLLEGYGATECAPVIACNVPRDNTPGTVGRLLPSIEMRLDPVEGITEGGRLSVRGPNVMLGYMLADQPGVIVPPTDGWHDTGDIVATDPAGLLSIKGRAKRFAKVGGEMVSLAAIEGVVATLWPDENHVVLARSDDRKGEQLVLLTERQTAETRELIDAARGQGFPELWLPKRIVKVDAIPLLGSGKVDFPAANRMIA